MFGLWRSRGAEQQGAADVDGALPGLGLASLARAAGAAGAEDLSWVPLPASAEKRREPLPYGLKQHRVKAHLQDSSTAVVDLRTVVDAPHDLLFNLLADPYQHERIFDAIESVDADLVLEEGPVSFELREPGFLRKYEGTWTIIGPGGRADTGGSPPQGSIDTRPETLRSPSCSGQEAPPSPSGSTSFTSASASTSGSASPDSGTPRSSAASTPRSESSAASSRGGQATGGAGAEVLKGHASGQVAEMLEGLLRATAAKAAAEARVAA
ncbi:hypothetical protein GPECTOR_36g118 [Gonium pectorale]|uniref:Uncharacterized protein n=1 Tax=Gonium pectorale TaxID=33097 RepID=A0A150GCH3_GONPE|nr:hypothetical protein GPECTOR_36g118 [Gonium pectorale]|eukprot:KXZ47265.1 hypothetical protein GPECTOR_36g118 [Gonium pectorale]